MKAARWYGRRDVRVNEIDEPGEPPTGWVRLRVQACGLCGTDVEEFTSGPVFAPRTPHPLTGQCAPLTLGHEFVGVVDMVGRQVDLAVGTSVAVDGNMWCGRCSWCLSGRPTLCPQLAQLGLQADGGLAELVLAPAYSCVPYAGIEPTVAVFAEPLSVAVRAVARGRVGSGDRVGVVGGGTIGLLIAQVARSAGAATVLVVEPHADRRELATRFGADRALDPQHASEAIDELTAGHGLDVVFDAAGIPAVSSTAVRWTRRGGRTVLLSVFDADVPVPMLDVLRGEKEIIASLSHSHDGDFPEAVRLLESGAVDPRPLISDRIALTDVVTRGFATLVAEPDRHLKVLVLP